MNRFGKIVDRVASAYSDKELRALYDVLFQSKEPGLDGLITLISRSIWDIEKVNWPAVKRELEKYPSGRNVARGMEALPEFKDMSEKGYWAVMKGKGIPRIGKQPSEWRDLIRTWEDFERKVLHGIEEEMVEYYMGPGRAELKMASLKVAFSPSFDTDQEFVDFLQGTLIPDLEESKMVETAKDFETVCKLINQERKDSSFINYLKHTLIPDLKESGLKATAQDFEEGIYWMTKSKKAMMAPGMVICPQCKGRGKITIEGTETTDKGTRKLPPVSIDCISCNGKGRITERELERHKKERALWCKCGNSSGRTEFFDDGEHPNCSKHCWVCEDCGGIVQVG